MTRNRLLLAFLSTLAFVAVGSAVRADDWPGFRNADRSGISKEKGLLAAWPKTGPKLLWTYKDAGLGFSSLAIVDGKVYTMGHRGTGKDETEVVIALDAGSGKELWTAKVGPIFTFKDNTWGDGPRSTPTVVGDRLYALGGQGILVCLDLASKGKEVWRVDFVKDLGGVMMSEWGFSESVLVDGDHLICTPGGEKGTTACLDRATGKVIWRSTDLTNKAPYSATVVAEIHGVRQYVAHSYINDSAGGVTSGIRAKDGKVLWTESIFKQQSYAIGPAPIVTGNQVYVSTGYGGGCHLFDIDKSFKVKDLYTSRVRKSAKNTHGGVVLLDGYIYGHSEGLNWFCQELKTGKTAWDARNTLETKSGSTIAADGKLYVLTEDGMVGLFAADPKELTEISSFKLPAESAYLQSRPTSRASRCWAHPAIANGRLFVRDHEFVWCYDIKQQ